MLTTLIYRSQLNLSCETFPLDVLVEKAKRSNAAVDVTGMLLFDGAHFLQVLEGPEETLDALFSKISQDIRHQTVVELMRDYAPRRRFATVGMVLFDLRLESPQVILDSVLRYGKLESYLAADDRVFKFIERFATTEHRPQAEVRFDPNRWVMEPKKAPFQPPSPQLWPGQMCQFALQPIVEPLGRTISSLEALVRSNNGGSPEHFFSAIPDDQIYEVDLQTKAYAFALAEKIGIGNHKIAINLLPMSLVYVPGAVEFLLEKIAEYRLSPEQVVVEVTENEVISGVREFTHAIKKLRAAGIGLAIDDFGSGYAGLSLLTKFQPDKIKIDREIVSNIHLSGPKQAIVNSIIKCCSELEITIVAEGIERLEEWCWLESAGIRRFQGFLFARPLLNGVNDIHWPTFKL